MREVLEPVGELLLERDLDVVQPSAHAVDERDSGLPAVAERDEIVDAIRHERGYLVDAALLDPYGQQL